jgi:hypothetical protein
VSGALLAFEGGLGAGDGGGASLAPFNQYSNVWGGYEIESPNWQWQVA